MADINEEVQGENSAHQEYWQLVTSSIYAGKDIPRGDGKRVIVLPGLFGNDLYLVTLHHWLHRIGYTTALSGLTLNAGCPRRLLEQIKRAVDTSLKDYDGPVAIIGHSRGGLLAKALSAHLGDRTSHLIALGSPLGSVLRGGRDALVPARASEPKTLGQVVRNASTDMIRMLDPDCDIPVCDCAYVDAMFAPLPVDTQVTAIFSENDGVVPSAIATIDGALNIEVSGSHTGLVFNREVYPHIAAALSR